MSQCPGSGQGRVDSCRNQDGGARLVHRGCSTPPHIIAKAGRGGCFPGRRGFFGQWLWQREWLGDAGPEQGGMAREVWLWFGWVRLCGDHFARESFSLPCTILLLILFLLLFIFLSRCCFQLIISYFSLWASPFVLQALLSSLTQGRGKVGEQQVWRVSVGARNWGVPFLKHSLIAHPGSYFVLS